MTGRRVTPDCVLIAPYSTPREEWLRLRQSGIGGSDALAVLGLDQWKTRMEVWLDKTGQINEREATDRMRWGTFVEETIGRWFAAEKGLRIRRCGLLESVARPWQKVSLDYLTADGGVLEIKNTNFWRRGDWADGQVADGAEAQAQHALAVTGRSHCWFAAQVGGDPPEIRRVERDDALIADMNAIEAEFWALVQAGEPPALEGTASADLVARLFPEGDPTAEAKFEAGDLDILRGYQREQQAEAAAKRRKEELKAQACALIGGAAKAVYDGETVATWANTSRTNCDVERLRKEFPAAAAAVLTSKPGRRFNCTLPKGDS